MHHLTGDFGEVTQEKAAATSIVTKVKIVSRYTAADGSEILVTTEDGVTTITTPAEY